MVCKEHDILIERINETRVSAEHRFTRLEMLWIISTVGTIGTITSLDIVGCDLVTVLILTMCSFLAGVIIAYLVSRKNKKKGDINMNKTVLRACIRAGRMTYLGIGLFVIGTIIAFLTAWLPYVSVKYMGLAIAGLAALGFADKYLRDNKEKIAGILKRKKTVNSKKTISVA